MNIKIKSKDISISHVIEEYVSKKISLLEKFLHSDDEALYEVELTKSTKHQNAGDDKSCSPSSSLADSVTDRRSSGLYEFG